MSKFNEKSNVIICEEKNEENDIFTIYDVEDEKIYDDPEELKIEDFDQDIMLSEVRLIKKDNNKKRINSLSFKRYNFYVCREFECEEGTTSEFCNIHRCKFQRYELSRWTRCQSIKAKKDGCWQKYCKEHCVYLIRNKEIN